MPYHRPPLRPMPDLAANVPHGHGLPDASPNPKLAPPTPGKADWSQSPVASSAQEWHRVVPKWHKSNLVESESESGSLWGSGFGDMIPKKPMDVLWEDNNPQSPPPAPRLAAKTLPVSQSPSPSPYNLRKRPFTSAMDVDAPRKAAHTHPSLPAHPAVFRGPHRAKPETVPPWHRAGLNFFTYLERRKQMCSATPTVMSPLNPDSRHLPRYWFQYAHNFKGGRCYVNAPKSERMVSRYLCDEKLADVNRENFLAHGLRHCDSCKTDTLRKRLLVLRYHEARDEHYFAGIDDISSSDEDEEDEDEMELVSPTDEDGDGLGLDPAFVPAAPRIRDLDSFEEDDDDDEASDGCADDILILESQMAF